MEQDYTVHRNVLINMYQYKFSTKDDNFCSILIYLCTKNTVGYYL